MSIHEGITMKSIRPILVFTSEYTGNADFNREGVDNTKKLFDDAFFSSNGLNIPNEHSLILYNEFFVPACDKIKKYIRTIDKNNEILLFYFCGHGFPDHIKKTVYLAMSDTTDENYNTCGYNIQELISLIKENRIMQYIVILDCCFSGYLCGMGNGTEEPAEFSVGLDEKGCVYISSTMSTETCRQIIINNRFYLPFSYYFANVLLGEYIENSVFWSIENVYECINKQLVSSHYPCKTEIQQKDGLSNIPIFLIRNNRTRKEQTIQFGEYFDTTVLNVLLVKTAIDHPIKQDDFGVPLGLWMLKGYLSTTGLSLNVEIYDERLELIKCNNDSEKRKEVINRFADVISEYDVIGISMCSSEVIPALRKFKIAKAANKVTFCGGIFTTSNEECLLKTKLIDYVVPGVGTVPLGNLLGRLLEEKKQGYLGKQVLDVDGVASSQNLSRFDAPWVPAQLPSMRKSIWIEILNRYRPFLEDKMDVYTARGCDKNCSFCSVQLESKQVVFRKEEQCVIEEIEYLKSVGIKYFSFKDEDFVSKPDRMMRILGAVSDINNGIKFKIRARYDEIVASGITLKQLQELGVVEIQYGIESPDIHIRKFVRKGFERSRNEELVNFIREHTAYNITANCSFILGIMGEDSEYYNELVKFIKAIYNESSKPKIYINFLTPHPYNSRFPLDNYSLVTDDLNYFTHKYPVCRPKNSSRGLRIGMLQVYDKIVEETNSQMYNPPSKNMPEELKQRFIRGDVLDISEVCLERFD